MEITEKDRLTIQNEISNIREICDEIITLNQSPCQNKAEILKKIGQVLSHSSTLSTFSRNVDIFDTLRRKVHHIKSRFDSQGSEQILKSQIESFCIEANSIRLDFSESTQSVELEISKMPSLKIKIEDKLQ